VTLASIATITAAVRQRGAGSGTGVAVPLGDDRSGIVADFVLMTVQRLAQTCARLTVSCALAALAAREGGVSAADSPATTPAAREAASALLSEGAALYGEGRFADALEKFRSAYAQYPSPKILFNFGQAYRGLGRHADALEAFEGFVRDNPNASEDLVAMARKHIADLETRVATVVVSSSLPGIDVLVDGRPVGRTPLARPARLDPGVHVIVFERAAAGAERRRLDLRAGQNVVVDAPLLRATSPAPAPALAPLTQRESPSPHRPLYVQWWVWTAVAVVAAGAAGTYLATRPPEPVCSSCSHVIPVPP
jgi:hypothetical protein